jgi:uncharacterized protein YdhG (YjbR/CyaY superfamily)
MKKASPKSAKSKASQSKVTPSTNTETIDSYIENFPAKIQAVLQKVRATIQKAAPDADEVISYRMPAFKWNGIVVYFAGWKEHVGLYPPIRGDAELEKAVAPYAGPKGNLQFPLDKPMPYALLTKIVKHRLKQNAARKGAKVTSAKAKPKTK